MAGGHIDSKWTNRDWWLGRTPQQQATRREASTDFASARDRLPSVAALLRAAIGIVAVFAFFYLWFHEGHLGESVVFGVSLGLVLSGAALPRRHDAADVVSLKRTLTAICLSAALVLFFTNSILAALIGGVILGLILAWLYQLLSDVGDAGAYARKRMHDDDKNE